MKIYYLEGRRKPDQQPVKWLDKAGKEPAIFLSREAAKLEIPEMLKQGWSEIRVYSDPLGPGQGDSYKLEVSTVRMPDAELYQAPEAHPLANGINPPKKEEEPVDETLQRLKAYRIAEGSRGPNPHNCFLYEWEQETARRMLDW
jgi:hypothetical protein